VVTQESSFLQAGKDADLTVRSRHIVLPQTFWPSAENMLPLTVLLHSRTSIVSNFQVVLVVHCPRYSYHTTFSRLLFRVEGEVSGSVPK